MHRPHRLLSRHANTRGWLKSTPTAAADSYSLWEKQNVPVALWNTFFRRCALHRGPLIYARHATRYSYISHIGGKLSYSTHSSMKFCRGQSQEATTKGWVVNSAWSLFAPEPGSELANRTLANSLPGTCAPLPSNYLELLLKGTFAKGNESSREHSLTGTFAPIMCISPSIEVFLLQNNFGKCM